jgi:hypothetical protein
MVMRAIRVMCNGSNLILRNAREAKTEEQRTRVRCSLACTLPPPLLNRLMAELDLFVGNTPQHDDVTSMLKGSSL